MKKTQLLSIVFSLIMFTGVTAGSVVFAEPIKHPMIEKIDELCEMSDVEKETFFEAYPNVADYRDKIEEICQLETYEERLAYFEKANDQRRQQNAAFGSMDDYCTMSDEQKKAHVLKHNIPPFKLELANKYCSVDESERHEFIEKYMKNANDFALHYEMSKVLNGYCQMSAEEQTVFIEKHNKSEEQQTKMNSYCLMDAEGKEAFIQEHKEKFAKHLEKKNFVKRTTYELNQYCKMSAEEQTAMIKEKSMPEYKVAKINQYCVMDEDAKAEYIEEKYREFKKYLDDTNKRNKMQAKLNNYCEMSSEEKAALIEKYDKSEDKISKMNEYCSLDEDEKQAFIKEHFEKYSKHQGDKKMYKTHMKGTHGDFKTLKSEFHALKERLADESLSAEEKQDLRKEFIERAKTMQLSWVRPQN